MATFGSDNSQPFDELQRIISRLFVAARALGRHYWQQQGRTKMSEEQQEQHLTKMHEYEQVF